MFELLLHKSLAKFVNANPCMQHPALTMLMEWLTMLMEWGRR